MHTYASIQFCIEHSAVAWINFLSCMHIGVYGPNGPIGPIGQIRAREESLAGSDALANGWLPLSRIACRLFPMPLAYCHDMKGSAIREWITKGQCPA